MRHVSLNLIVWALLLGLLALTILASMTLTGPASFIASMLIALAKAALVYWFYMHLREVSGLIRFAAVAGGIWLMIFFVLGSADYLTR
jgi:cytochrome c oxidase subunit 4